MTSCGLVNRGRALLISPSSRRNTLPRAESPHERGCIVVAEHERGIVQVKVRVRQVMAGEMPTSLFQEALEAVAATLFVTEGAAHQQQSSAILSGSSGPV